MATLLDLAEVVVTSRISLRSSMLASRARSAARKRRCSSLRFVDLGQGASQRHQMLEHVVGKLRRGLDLGQAQRPIGGRRAGAARVRSRARRDGRGGAGSSRSAGRASAGPRRGRSMRPSLGSTLPFSSRDRYGAGRPTRLAELGEGKPAAPAGITHPVSENKVVELYHRHSKTSSRSSQIETAKCIDSANPSPVLRPNDSRVVSRFAQILRHRDHV